MNHKSILFIFLNFFLCSISAQLPTQIEVSNCVYSANGNYIVGQDVQGCQCFDRVNGNDRIAVWTQPNFPDNRAFVFEAGQACADGGPVSPSACLRQAVSEYCHIIDSHGTPNCNNCIVTIIDREPCLDTILLNDFVIPDDTYQSTEIISSNGIVDTNSVVTFRSNEIVLAPDFQVLSPSVFEALIEPDECDNYFCPPFEDAPTFVQSFTDITLNADENCEAFIQIPFQIDYVVPNNVSAYSFAVNNATFDFISLDVALVSVNGSISDFILSGSLPLGSYRVEISVKDSNCNLSAFVSINTTVNNSGMIPTFDCKELAIPLTDSLNVIVHSTDIVCVTDPNACDPSSNHQLISSFSIDPNDTVRIYDCSDVGDNQVTMFTWDVLDQDGNGVLDTMLRQLCFAVQTIYDPQNYCP